MYSKIICLDLTTAVYNFKQSSISYLVQNYLSSCFHYSKKKKNCPCKDLYILSERYISHIL